MAEQDFASCGSGSSSMLDPSCLLKQGWLLTNFTTASPKTRKSQKYVGLDNMSQKRAYVLKTWGTYMGTLSFSVSTRGTGGT